MCEVTGDDIAGGYWERLSDDPLPNGANMSSVSDNNTKIKLLIDKARPKHSGEYCCVSYSQWGVARSNKVTVAITSNVLYCIGCYIECDGKHGI